MTEAATKFDTQDIVVEEVFPNAPETIWKTLTSGELIDRWLMKSMGFEPVKGARFTLQTTPAGAWDGVIHCRVLEVVHNERLSYSWQGGHDGNAQYGSRLDTIVTWTLAKVDGGTRLRLVHSGFVLPKNVATFRNLSEGWKKVIAKLVSISGGRPLTGDSSSSSRTG
jgi:uncharacterized protein YndB with AHSA1/START domain